MCPEFFVSCNGLCKSLDFLKHFGKKRLRYRSRYLKKLFLFNVIILIYFVRTEKKIENVLIENRLKNTLSKFQLAYQHTLLVTIEEYHFKNNEQINDSRAHTRNFCGTFFPSQFSQTHEQKT